MERYPEQTTATIECLRISGWREALAAGDREGYSSMWQSLSTAARTAIENGLLSEGKGLWLLADASCSMMLNGIVMNAVHTPTNSDTTVVDLRNLLATVDAQVAAAYGWTDIEITYDFREFAGGSVNEPWRWAPSEEVTAELMRRLTELNRKRFEELSLAQATAPSPAKRGRRPKAASSMPLNDLFAGDKV